MEMLQTVIVAVVSGAVSGLIAWGGLKSDVNWMRILLSEIKTEVRNGLSDAHRRIDDLITRVGHERPPRP